MKNSVRRFNKSISNFFSLIRFHFRRLSNHLFNKVVREQNRNYKKIPIIIISFNQLLSLKKLIKILQMNGYEHIIIIDNNSTYKPLLEYYEKISTDIVIHRLPVNYGHRVFWKCSELFEEYYTGYYVLTDPDVIPAKGCPPDFVQKFKEIIDRNPNFDKVGFSLSLDKIPESNPKKSKIIKWEEKYWTKIDREGNYIAEIDTTFALYRPGKPFISYKGIRTRPPYIAIHEGWNVDPEKSTPEQEFYKITANSSASWNTF